MVVTNWYNRLDYSICTAKIPLDWHDRPACNTASRSLVRVTVSRFRGRTFLKLCTPMVVNKVLSWSVQPPKVVSKLSNVYARIVLSDFCEHVGSQMKRLVLVFRYGGVYERISIPANRFLYCIRLRLIPFLVGRSLSHSRISTLSSPFHSVT